jgi:hypothetical protein
VACPGELRTVAMSAQASSKQTTDPGPAAVRWVAI